MTVAPGELVAVVGPSGAGKSSLLAVAGGLTRPDEGRVRVDDVDIATASAAELARYRRERVGFVFQSGNPIPALTATDHSGTRCASPAGAATIGATLSRCWSAWAWPTTHGPAPTSCRVASGSAWASPVPS